MKHVIVNADDFGSTPQVNAAVMRARVDGVLTSASLMVTEPAWEQAVSMARDAPALGVGLHVVLTAGHAALARASAPHLVGADGRVPANPLPAGLRYGLSRAFRTDARNEMEAQFERFARTGLDWSHVDGHQHFHMHPAVWDHLLLLCERYGAHRLRVPREDILAHFRRHGSGPGLNTAAYLVLRLVARRNLRALRRKGMLGGRPIFLADRVYGSLQSGNMHATYLASLIRRLAGSTNEIYCHPGTAYARRLPAARQFGDVTDVELHALLDPGVREAIESEQVCLATYAEAEAVAIRRRAVP